MKRLSFPISGEGTLGSYLREIGKLQPLSSEQEAHLAARIRKNDPAAFDTLIKANLRFVVSVARNYQNQGMTLSDLINEGNVGLVRAAQKFDEKKNFRFISYAVWWIRQAILQALAEQSRIMRIPLSRAGAIHRISKTSNELEQKYNRLPDIAELAMALEWSEEAVLDTLRISSGHVSLDAPIKENDGSTLLDIMAESGKGNSPEDHINIVSFKNEICRMLTMLSRREREVIMLYFGLGGSVERSLDEIGERFNITRERVRQIKSKALDRLKGTPAAQALRWMSN